MGSAPSSETSSNSNPGTRTAVPVRRIVSVPNVREHASTVSSTVGNEPRRKPKNSSVPKDKATGGSDAIKVIRGGDASAIPEINKADEIVFETFYHRNGKNFTCMYVNNVRYYIDSLKSGEWKEFPNSWYGQGQFVTDDILAAGQQNHSADETTKVEIEVSNDKKKDNREGVIKIPGKGVFQTYIFEHRRNVHCYYDPDEASWIKLPLKWELKTDVAKRLVRNVQESCPQWLDECDLMASLRASNYNVEDCVNTFIVTEGTYGANVASGFEGTLAREKSMIVQNESLDEMARKLTKAERRLEEKVMELSHLEEENNYLKSKLEEMEEHLATTKAECSATIATVEALKKERPPSSKSRQIVEVPRDTVSPENLKKLKNDVKNLHQLQIKLSTENQMFSETITDQIKDINAAFKNLRRSKAASQKEIEEVTALYRREVLQRKMLYNQLQELRGNIRVFCRVRNDPSVKNCVNFDDGDVYTTSENGKKMFQFDKSFDASVTQEDVFNEVHPIITSCADGYNVSIMAYGQTGSGKTYTMIGPMPNPFKNPGVNIRAIKELFKICNERKETVDYRMHISMLEIYNECIQDLLSKDVKTVELRTKGNKVTLVDITELPVEKEKDIIDVMDLGTSNRKVASTKMNSQSSRSHLVLILTVIGTDKVSGTTSKGTLTLCDLAGSERVSKTEAQGARLAEAAFINKSLTSLGQVFAALKDNQLHVPYRNSKLTHILMPSLGGDAKACLFVNISPASENINETLSSLLFGVNARQVALGQAKKNVSKP